MLQEEAESFLVSEKMQGMLRILLLKFTFWMKLQSKEILREYQNLFTKK